MTPDGELTGNGGHVHFLCDNVQLLQGFKCQADECSDTLQSKPFLPHLSQGITTENPVLSMSMDRCR